MKKIIFALTLLLISAGTVQAWDPLETKEESRQRHSSENYEYYKKNGTPLGGYPEKLGDTAPYGTERPGYNSPKGGYGYDDYYNENNSGSRY